MNDSAGEDGLVAWLRGQISAAPGVFIGPGDDAAALNWPSDRPLLVTTDMLLEGSCFRLAEAGAYRVGRKSMAVNLSDIAAMAGIPRAAVVSVGLPRNMGGEAVRDLFRGMKHLADEFDVAIIGGDTNSHDGGLVISVTMLGEATPRGAVTRGGAKPGDWLFVTGPLGGSIRGHHLDFTPRVREALALHERVDIHAMIDISDGLAKELHRICTESHCGAVLHAERIPLAASGLAAALGDGEDFELLFAVSPDDGQRLANNYFHVGQCTSEGVWLELDGQRQPLPSLGYEHQFS